ncbi:MAG: hypothetical protein IH598_15375 [Bacteroidales bacterium]|nr:hypothetical protein [Bacteroidales bacterium]
MKLKFLFIVIAILLAFQPAISNPIMEEDIVTEIYFEDGNWYILINHNIFWLYGIESLQDISISSTNGPLIIDPDFIPNTSNAFTVLTVENLLQPVSISPEAGALFVAITVNDQYWELQEIMWGTQSSIAVGPVLPGQSINYLPFSYDQMQVVWMPIKNASPYFYNGYWNGTWEGVFQGYLTDHNGNPVENAEIKYINDLFLWPLGSLTPLTTTTGGFFQESLYAKMYHFDKVIKDGEEYEIDYWLNMEPGVTITMDLVVDMSVGMAEITRMYKVKFKNSPNPLKDQTTIELCIDEETDFIEGMININCLKGSVVAVIPFSRSDFHNNIFRQEWKNGLEYNLPEGQYLISVVMDGKKVADSKMIIAR